MTDPLRASALPRREWRVVADELAREQDPVKRSQLLRELIDSEWDRPLLRTPAI